MTFTVRFQPDDVSVEVASGTTILSAAGKAGVFINSLCGSDGVCGRCRVIVRDGKASGGETDFFTRLEIQQGYILACQGRIESDIVVEIPSETRLSGAPEHVEDDTPPLSDLARSVGIKFDLSPLVEKTFLKLDPPTLDNNISDLQRLEAALSNSDSNSNSKSFGMGDFQMGLKITRRLPDVLRKSNWHVTAVTGYRGSTTEIIDIEPADTSRRNFCIAVDIGTTTIVCHLVDLSDGSVLGREAKYNSQAAYGGDVIHRIIHADESTEKEKALRDAVTGDVNELISQLTRKYRIGTADISFICAAGNTTMMHLMLSLPAGNIRREPYTGVAYHLPPFRAAEVGLRINPRGLLYCLPCVAGFVGADIVAGIFSSGLSESEEVSMLIDIGTNGEIVVGNKDFLVCASASAGPAFEGAECSSGMRATKGAIDHIRLLDANELLNFSTVTSSAPAGICGTGYIDLIAELLRVRVIDKTGKLQEDSSNRVRTGNDDQPEYVVIPADQSAGNADITITQADINNILRAKGAIYAAQTVLLKSLGMTIADVSQVLVAGGFGNFLNVSNAVYIGLLPDVPLGKLKFVGNTSAAGAKLAAVSRDCYEEIFKIADRTTYFELSTEPTFMDEFVSACFFPHTNIELFPSVAAENSNKGKK